MEIIEKTNTKLRLYYKTPRPILLSIFGVLFIFVGLSSILFFAKKTTLECNKVELNRTSCTITIESFFNKQTDKIFAEKRLKVAKIDKKNNQDSDNRIILVTETEEVTIRNKFTFIERELKTRIEKINKFIKEPEIDSLIISQDNRFFSVFIAICFIVLGSGTIAIVLNQEDSEVFYTFDRSSRQLQITRKTLLNKITVSKWDFQDLEKATVTTEDKGDRNDRADIYHLELIRPSNENYPVYTFIGKEMKTVADRLARAINQFLK